MARLTQFIRNKIEETIIENKIKDRRDKQEEEEAELALRCLELEIGKHRDCFRKLPDEYFDSDNCIRVATAKDRVVYLRAKEYMSIPYYLNNNPCKTYENKKLTAPPSAA